MTTNTKPTLTPKLRFPEFMETAAWETKRGDELFDQISNREAPAGLPILAITQEFGAVPREDIDYHVSVSDKSVETYKEVCPGDFIISLRSFQGGIEYSNYHGICSPAYVILRKKTELSDSFFKLVFKSHDFIQQLTKNLEGLRDGKMISYKQFSEILLPWPKPAEQERIAECLSSLDELIGTESQKLDALKSHKKGLTKELFPREGEAIPRFRFPEFQKATEWKTDSLGEIFETSSGGTPSRSEKAYWNGNIPWITTSLVDFRVISNGEEFITAEGLANSSAKIFPKGTVLMAMYGQGKTRGQVALLGIPAATNQACAAILPRKDIEPYFVFLNLAGRYEELRELSNSGGQENLSQGLIREVRFTFPSDEAEQREVTSCLSSLDELITAQSTNLESLKTHKKGLMQQLFPSFAEFAA